MEVILSISKSAVLDEVSQTTSYVGAKKVGDDGSYERISTVDEDESALQRFWDDCCSGVSRVCGEFLVSEGMLEDGDTYAFVLNLPSLFNSAHIPGMERLLFSYFVEGIASRWFVYTDKDDADDYGTSSQSCLSAFHDALFERRRPVRPVYEL